MQMSEVLTGPIGIAAAGLSSVLAYTVAFVQWRRALPKRWSSLATAALTLAGGQLLAGRIQGTEWSVLLVMPAVLVMVALLAGGGSVAIYYTDEEGAPPSKATERARRRLGWTAVGVFVVGLVVVLAWPDPQA